MDCPLPSSCPQVLRNRRRPSPITGDDSYRTVLSLNAQRILIGGELSVWPSGRKWIPPSAWPCDWLKTGSSIFQPQTKRCHFIDRLISPPLLFFHILAVLYIIYFCRLNRVDILVHHHLVSFSRSFAVNTCRETALTLLYTRRHLLFCYQGCKAEIYIRRRQMAAKSHVLLFHL